MFRSVKLILRDSKKSVLGGFSITVVGLGAALLLLYQTVSDLIRIVGYGNDEHPMLQDLEEEVTDHD